MAEDAASDPKPANDLAAKFADPAQRPDTPCVAVCSTTFDEVCRGCGRTVQEVAQWVFMTAPEKDAVWDRIIRQGYPRRSPGR